MIGFELNGTPYYYVRNLQGDVTKIIDGSGNVVVQYAYGSWGKVLSITGSLASTVGAKNPIGYRGYYYDTESELYYLNSRYYDPETGRFISPDVVAEGGNLYTYCANDPVNRSDDSGLLSWNDIKNWGEKAVSTIKSGIEKAVLAVYKARKTVEGVKNNVLEDISNLNVFNIDPDVVRNAHYFSGYGGQLVILYGHTHAQQYASFSYGPIMGMHNAFKNDNWENTLKHEHGHYVQFMQLGLIKYTFAIALPSATHNDYYYHSQLWEVTADMLGGVPYSITSDPRSEFYHRAGAETAGWTYYNKARHSTMAQVIFDYFLCYR